MKWSEISLYDVIQSCFSFSLCLVNPLFAADPNLPLSLSCFARLSFGPSSTFTCVRLYFSNVEWDILLLPLRCASTADHDSKLSGGNDKDFIVQIIQKSTKTHRHFIPNWIWESGKKTKLKYFKWQGCGEGEQKQRIVKWSRLKRRFFTGILFNVKWIYGACCFYEFACKMFAIITVNFMLQQQQTFCNRLGLMIFRFSVKHNTHALWQLIVYPNNDKQTNNNNNSSSSSIANDNEKQKWNWNWNWNRKKWIWPELKTAAQ